MATQVIVGNIVLILLFIIIIFITIIFITCRAYVRFFKQYKGIWLTSRLPHSNGTIRCLLKHETVQDIIYGQQSKFRARLRVLTYGSFSISQHTHSIYIHANITMLNLDAPRCLFVHPLSTYLCLSLCMLSQTDFDEVYL